MICVFVSQALNKSKKAQVSSHTHTQISAAFLQFTRDEDVDV